MFPSSRLARRHSPSSFWAQCIALVVMLIAAGACSLSITDNALTEPYRLFAGFLFSVMCLLYPRIGVFTKYRPPAASLVFITAAWSVSMLAVFGSLRLMAQSLTFDTNFLIALYLLGWCAHAVVVLAYTSVLDWGRSRRVQDSVVLVGSGELARRIHWGLSRNRFLPEKVVGFVDDVEPGAAGASGSVPYLGRIEDLGHVVQRHGIKKVFIALPLNRSNQVELALNLVAETNTDVIWAPDTSALSLIHI